MLNTKNEIIEWLKTYKIKNYTVREDLIVDVDGDVDLNNENLTEIPIQFGIVSGYFSCCSNKLTSLEGGPKIVDDHF